MNFHLPGQPLITKRFFSIALSFSLFLPPSAFSENPATLEIEIPSRLGWIEKKFQAPNPFSSKGVILIQDAHGLGDVQKSLLGLTEYLQKNYSIQHVALEGATGPLDAVFFRAFPDAEKRENLFKHYIESGEISGAAAASVLSPYESDYRGVENQRLYETGILLFQKTRENQAEYEKYLLAARNELEGKKKKIYSKELQEWEKLVESFEKNPENLASLLSFAEKQRVKFSRFPYLKIIQEAMHHNRPLSRIRGASFSREFLAFNRAVSERLLTGVQPKKLRETDRQLKLLEKLSRLELTRSEWEEFKRKQNKILASYPTLLEDLSTHFSFYQNAEVREKAMFGNLIRYCLKPHAIFVAGGFHMPGITRMLESEGISYILISPAIGSLPQENPYFNHMQGRVSWRNYYEIKGGRVNLYDAFARAVRDQLLEHEAEGMAQGGKDSVLRQAPSTLPSAELLKSWRNQIIRNLSDVGRFEKAGEYTRFLDEILLQQIPDSEIKALRKKWHRIVDQFIQGLRHLKAENRLSSENILNLVSQSNIVPSSSVGIFQQRFTVSDRLLLLSANRSELRSTATTLVEGKALPNKKEKRHRRHARRLATRLQGNQNNGRGLISQYGSSITRMSDSIIASNFYRLVEMVEKKEDSLERARAWLSRAFLWPRAPYERMIHTFLLKNHELIGRAVPKQEGGTWGEIEVEIFPLEDQKLREAMEAAGYKDFALTKGDDMGRVVLKFSPLRRNGQVLKPPSQKKPISEFEEFGKKLFDDESLAPKMDETQTQNSPQTKPKTRLEQLAEMLLKSLAITRSENRMNTVRAEEISEISRSPLLENFIFELNKEAPRWTRSYILSQSKLETKASLHLGALSREDLGMFGLKAPSVFSKTATAVVLLRDLAFRQGALAAIGSIGETLGDSNRVAGVVAESSDVPLVKSIESKLPQGYTLIAKNEIEPLISALLLADPKVAEIVIVGSSLDPSISVELLRRKLHLKGVKIKFKVMNEQDLKELSHFGVREAIETLRFQYQALTQSA